MSNSTGSVSRSTGSVSRSTGYVSRSNGSVSRSNGSESSSSRSKKKIYARKKKSVKNNQSSRASHKGYKSKSRAGSTSKVNRYNNVKLHPIRQMFYNTLGVDIHENYIKYFFELTTLLNKEFSKVNFKYKKYVVKMIPNKPGHYIQFFGGAVFFMLFFEAKSLNLFSEEDMEILQYFLKYKTIDIDGSAKFSIKPELKYDDEEKNKEILDNISKQYQQFIIEAITKITEQHKNIRDFIIMLVENKKFKGLKFNEDESLIPNIGIAEAFSVNMQTNYNSDEGYELRPQINTCIEDINHCDHIIEILTKNDTELLLANLYNFKTCDEFLGKNLILSCSENLDRFYRTIIETVKQTTLKGIISKIKSYFKTSPLSKVKYLQGFHRVQLVQLILSKIITSQSPKYNNIKKLYILPDKVVVNIRNTFTKGLIITNFLTTPKKREISIFFDYLEKKKFEERTIEDSNNILLLIIDIWIIINDKILEMYKKNDIVLTEYRAAPDYSSENNDNNRLYTRIGVEFGIDFDSDTWEDTITDKQITNIFQKLFKQKIAVSTSLKKIILKKIKKKLEI